MNRSLLLLLLAVLFTLDASADAVPAATPVAFNGTTVIGADWRKALVGAGIKPGAAGGAEASGEMGGVAGGVRLITLRQPEHAYSLQATVLNEIAVKKGDTLLLRFAARSLQADRNTGSTKLKVGFSKNAPDWDSSYSGEIGVGAAWQRFDMPFVAKNDFAPREARVVFQFGYPAQQAEVADLQLIRYPAEVGVAALPKTERFADTYPAEVVDAELARIVAMRKALESVSDPSPAHGRTLHVATDGAASGDGSAARPFASIPQALAIVQPGDTILVAAGDYRHTTGIAVRTSGRPDAWIKIKAAPGVRPRLISSGWSGIELRGGIAYVEIDGFELTWVPNPADKTPVHGSGIAPMYASHHIRILNNIVHGFGTGGIITLDADYIHIEGNVAYNNAKTSPYGGSCISLCRAFDFDLKPGYHNVIRRNVCYDNELLVSVLETSGGNGKALTDGNGIIIDVFNRSRANPLKPHYEDRNGPLAPYHGRTLIENNLMYDNGGRGIHIFRSSNVDVVNNTTAMNQKSADIQAGEYTAIEASGVVFVNNIAYGRKDKRANSQDGSSRVIWLNNLFYNHADVLRHAGMVESDPLFTAPGPTAAAEGFALQPGSPARGKAIAQVAPPVDMTGRARLAEGVADLGALQR